MEDIAFACGSNMFPLCVALFARRVRTIAIHAGAIVKRRGGESALTGLVRR
jgi:hypothetical protein